MAPDDEMRVAFEAASDWYLSVLDRVPADSWDQPGLGVWTVRELAAHTARALITIETYLADPPAEVVVPDVNAYFGAALGNPAVHEGVAERGRQEAAKFGDDLVPAVGAIASRVRGIVASTPRDVTTGSAAGGMRFDDYLSTRVLELTVHTCDICAAIRLDVQPPIVASEVTFAIFAGLAARHPRRADILRGLGGRTGLPAGCNVLG